MKLLLTGFAAACVLVTSAAAYAHDFFLIPDQFTSSKTGSQNVQASVGSNFPTPENVVTADRVDRVFAVGAGNPRLTVAGPGAKALNLRFMDTKRGTVIAAVKTKDRDVEYADDRIPIILEEYRVSPAAAAAIAALPKPRILKVSSRRFAKTLMCIQQCNDRAVATRPLGTELEFVSVARGTDHFRLLSQGRLLANYPVDLVTADAKRRHMMTDGKGEAHLPTDARGSLMLFAAVMTPPVAGDRFTLDLSTLTFSRP